MSKKKRFTLEEIRHLRANPYAVHDRGRDLLHARLQGGVLGPGACKGTLDRPPSASWATIRKFWALSGSKTPPSAFDGKPSL